MMLKCLLMSLLLIQGLATLYPVSAQVPVITNVQVNNPRSLTVTWTAIASSSGYIIRRYIPSTSDSPTASTSDSPTASTSPTTASTSGSPTTGTSNIVTVAGTSNTSYTFSGLTPYDYTSNVGVTFTLAVLAYFDLPSDSGDSSINVTATLPLCPGLCDYRTHRNVFADCSVNSMTDCVCNPAFSGPNCTEPTFVPLQVEFEPSRILSGTDYALQVTWRAPEPITLDGRLVNRYAITLRNQISSQSTIVLSDNTISASTNSYELANLQSGAVYSVEVATVSDVDQDPPAVILLNNPPFTVFTPGPVATISVQVIASSHISVSWSPPNGSLNYHSLLQVWRYDLSIVLGNTVVTSSVFAAGVSQVSYGIGENGFIVDTLYTVEISANNAAGQGAVSSFAFTIPGLQCNDNQYGLPNATTCSSCPSNSISETGSTTISDCICLDLYTRLESGGTVICFLACDLLTLNNGNVTYSNDNRGEGAMAFYDCCPGYTLTGSQSRSCEGVISGGSSSVQWTNSQSSCVVTQCNLIFELGLNGNIVYSTEISALSRYEYSTVATYNCSLGYEPTASGVRTCLDGNDGTVTGRWSNSEVTCEVACDLLTLNNGNVTYSNDSRFEGTMAFYDCFPGYTLTGSQTRSCVGVISGGSLSVEWTNNQSSCIVTQCNLIFELGLNGNIIYSTEISALSRYEYSTVATYNCSLGYEPTASGVRTCLDGNDGTVTGRWSNSEVTCEEVLACNPLTIGNGVVTYSQAVFTAGTIANYSCNTGYALSQVLSVTCVINILSRVTHWSPGNRPICIPIRCNGLSTENLLGVINYTPDPFPLYNYGTTALYTCNQGYLANGTGMRNCTNSIVIDGTVTGVWNGDPVSCESILCPGLQAPVAGFVAYTSPDGSEIARIENGTLASYSCSVGHHLVGLATLTCVVDLDIMEGLWSDSEPTCQPCPVGYFNSRNTSTSCLACQELYTTSDTGSTACDTCLYSSPSPLGCFVFDTTVNFFEPITNDVTIVAGEGTVLVRLTLRWPAVPLSVVDIEGNQVGQSVRIKINCAAAEGITSSQYCTNDNTPLIADLNGISDIMYTIELLGLVRYTFNFVIVAGVNSNFADGPPGESLSFTTPATNDNDVRLPRILSISASPSGYVIVYEMDFQLAPILTSISSLYNSQSNPNTVYNGLQLSNDVVDIPVTGTLNATTLIAADQVVDFVLNTVVGLYVYKSPVYTLNPNIMPLNNILPPSIDFSQSTVLNSSSVLVVWSEAEGAFSYGVVVDRVVGGGGLSRVVRITTTSLSLVVTMLTPSMRYTVRVASQDQAGFGGPLTSPFTFILPEDLPGPPNSVTLVVDGSFIDISWNPPTSPNGIITHYNVILTLLTGTTTFNTDNLSFRLPKPDMAYSVGVQAVNSVGNGETIFAFDTISTDAPTTDSPRMEGLSMEIIIAIAAAGGGALVLGLVLCLLFIGCCCYYRRRSRNAFSINTSFAAKNMNFECEMEGVTATKLERSMMSSSSLAPLVPIRYTNQTTATDASMYAEVNEMQMLKARETVKHATPLPYEEFLPKREATPDDYNNEELYMEMGKIYYADINKTDILSTYEVDRSAIIIQSDLGKGQFGKVSQAKMKNVLLGKAESVVAVKMLKEGATDSARKDFLSEAQMLAAFDHSNVLGLLKVVTKSEPVLVIIPFMVNGDLKNYLKSMKKKLSIHARDNQRAQFGVPKQLHIAEQIAGGMEYLAAKFFIHRDLAARNILVGEDNHCKIADFGLSRALAQEDTYYHVSEASLLPVKWMAIESLFYRKFSTYSDVWSFGVVLWEIFSYGAGPYKGVSPVGIPTHIQKGNRLECPEKCPAEVYEMMNRCWDEVKEKRGTFSQIKLRLKSITISLQRSKDKNQLEEDMYI